MQPWMSFDPVTTVVLRFKISFCNRTLGWRFIRSPRSIDSFSMEGKFVFYICLTIYRNTRSSSFRVWWNFWRLPGILSFISKDKGWCYKGQTPKSLSKRCGTFFWNHVRNRLDFFSTWVLLFLSQRKNLKERRVSMDYVSFFKLLHILSYHDKLLCHILQAIPLIIKPWKR